MYYLRAPLVLNTSDSWLSISNYERERSEVSGAVPLEGLRWQLEPRARRSSGGPLPWRLFNGTNNVFGKVLAGRDAPCCKCAPLSRTHYHHHHPTRTWRSPSLASHTTCHVLHMDQIHSRRARGALGGKNKQTRYMGSR